MFLASTRSLTPNVYFSTKTYILTSVNHSTANHFSSVFTELTIHRFHWCLLFCGLHLSFSCRLLSISCLHGFAYTPSDSSPRSITLLTLSAALVLLNIASHGFIISIWKGRSLLYFLALHWLFKFHYLKL